MTNYTKSIKNFLDTHKEIKVLVYLSINGLVTYLSKKYAQTELAIILGGATNYLVYLLDKRIESLTNEHKN
jgi:hypothetical protein